VDPLSGHPPGQHQQPARRLPFGGTRGGAACRADSPAPVTTAPAQWPDVERLFGMRGEPSRCWCRFFALTGAEWNASTPQDRKTQLREKFDGAAPAPGVLAFRDGEPVGWCAVEPRDCYPRILRSQVLKAAGPADLYQGTLLLFLAASFEVVSDAVPGRAVVRLVAPA
jgi:hypothetical protein